MAQTYTYPITAFPNDAVEPLKLEDEIIASSITASPTGTTSHEGNVNVTLSQTLTGAEETTLDGVVAAHDGVPYPRDEFGKVVAQTDTQKEDYKAFAQQLFSDHPEWRKVFKAMLRELLEEINRTKNPKAQMSIVNGNNVQLMTSKTWEQITTFSLEDGRASDFDTLSVVLSASKIVSTTRGRHFVSLNISFEGDADSEFGFEIAVNGNTNDNIRARAKLGAAGDIRSCTAAGFVAMPIDQPGVNEITLMCRNFENDDRNIRIVECQIAVFKLENRVGRALNEMIVQIDGQFDKDD